MHGCLLITIGLINMDRSNVGNPIKKIKKSMVITCKILKWTTPLLVVVLNISNIEQIFSNSTYGQWQIQATWVKLIWCTNCAHSMIENRVLEKMNLWWAYIALVSKKKKKKKTGEPRLEVFEDPYNINKRLSFQNIILCFSHRLQEASSINKIKINCWYSQTKCSNKMLIFKSNVHVWKFMSILAFNF